MSPDKEQVILELFDSFIEESRTSGDEIQLKADEALKKMYLEGYIDCEIQNGELMFRDTQKSRTEASKALLSDPIKLATIMYGHRPGEA